MRFAQNVPNKNDNKYIGSSEPESDAFDTFWQAFPKRNPHSNGDKKATEKKFWLAIEKKGATVELLNRKAREYAAYVRRENSDPKYIVQATRWFNEERWRTDNHDTAAKPQSAGRGPSMADLEREGIL